MKKYIVYTRAIPGHHKVNPETPTVIEVEGELVKGVEDPSVMWIPTGEYLFRIIKPTFLSESVEIKKVDGTKEKMTIPPVYYSHAIYDTVEDAYDKAKKLIRSNFEFEERKRHVAFTEEEVKEKYSEITEITL